MEIMKEFTTNAVLAKDEITIKNSQSDLSEFCNLLNRLFADLIKGGFIGLNDITREMMLAAANFNAEPIIRAVSDKYEKEANRIKYERAKRDFIAGNEKAAANIKAIVKQSRDYYEKHALKFYKPQDGGLWRLKYLTLRDGHISFDNSKLIADNASSIVNEAQADFLNRAKSLYEQIAAFNKERKELSSGTVSGIYGFCIAHQYEND